MIMGVEKKNNSGFDIGHELVMILSKSESTLEMDDAVRVFNQAYGVLRSQLETLERIDYYGRDRF